MPQFFWGGYQDVPIGDPWINIDGRLNAPAGTPQYPHLLDLSSSTNGLGRNLAVRPPWHVAGVDYHVGIDRNLYPTNANLKDPTAGGLPTGVSFAGTTVTVTSTSPVTLDGWDFGVSNGLQIFIKGTANGGGGTLTVSNSNFKIGSNNLCPIVGDADAGPLNLTNVEMDGNGAFLNTTFGSSGQGTLVAINSPATTILYNWWKNAFEDGFDPSCNAGQHQTITFKYCLFDTNSFNASAHSDWLQINNAQDGTLGGRGFTDNCICLFNTNFQQNSALNNQQSMFRLNTQVNGSEIAYNTAVVGSTAQSNTFFDIVEAAGTFPAGDDPCTIVNPSLHDNYVLQDNFTHPWFNGFYTSGALPLAHGIVNPYENNNIDIFTGLAFSNTT